jgi:hypothetical protein
MPKITSNDKKEIIVDNDVFGDFILFRLILEQCYLVMISSFISVGPKKIAVSLLNEFFEVELESRKKKNENRNFEWNFVPAFCRYFGTENDHLQKRNICWSSSMHLSRCNDRAERSCDNQN